MLTPYKPISSRKVLTESDPIQELKRLVESKEYQEAVFGPAAKEMSPEDEKAFTDFVNMFNKTSNNLVSQLYKIKGLDVLGKQNIEAFVQPMMGVPVMVRLSLQYPSVMAKALIASNNYSNQMTKLNAKYPPPAEDNSIMAALGKMKSSAQKKMSAVKGMASQLSKIIKAGAKGAVQGAVQGVQQATQSTSGGSAGVSSAPAAAPVK